MHELIHSSQSDLHPRNLYFLNLLCKDGEKKELTPVKIQIALYKKVKILNFHDKCQFYHFFHEHNTYESLSNNKSRAYPFFQIEYFRSH